MVINVPSFTHMCLKLYEFCMRSGSHYEYDMQQDLSAFYFFPCLGHIVSLGVIYINNTSSCILT